MKVLDMPPDDIVHLFPHFRQASPDIGPGRAANFSPSADLRSLSHP